MTMEVCSTPFLFLEENHVRQYQKQYRDDSEVCQHEEVNNLPTVEKALKTVFRVLFEVFEGIDVLFRFSGYTV
jgi:hypothetical protein